MIDTICAIATPPGMGGIGIVRISGPLAPQLAQAVLEGVPPARVATLSLFRDEQGRVLDQGVAVFFPAPASFTGEDVLELHGHGSPVVLDRLIQALVMQGARCARPGEFTERAFLNGKIDLVQAEAVADLIESAHEGAARAAANTLQGAFSAMVRALDGRLADLRCHVEAALDFPDEALDIAEDAALAEALTTLSTDIAEAARRGREGRVLREGVRVAIAGPPNAGKSTLLNALAGHEAAIVSPYPGTTRDLVRERVVIEGLALELTDSAGLRATDDPVEREGIRRAEVALAQADCVLWLVDDSAETPPPAPPASLIIYTKIDISGRASGPCPEGYAVCAPTGAGIAALRAGLRARFLAPAQYAEVEGAFTARRRHVVALEKVGRAIAAALTHQGEGSAELVAEELRLAHEGLGEITGRFTSEDLLGRIFSAFCIGK
ncbi:MAG: tRNA uridine-5-carboxymethylaminomethyl(34) synthesis GTPase MnmE [Gammaproteobacteria bacterium]|nr:tRNA uridine-5-carboxymethylaminomethyl(34) synthesis GTPase MnmE [Gammaproteobacteria bacterium]